MNVVGHAGLVRECQAVLADCKRQNLAPHAGIIESYKLNEFRALIVGSSHFIGPCYSKSESTGIQTVPLYGRCL